MDSSTTENNSRSILLRTLDRIERIGNALPHPATLFVIFSLAVILLSWFMAKAGVGVTYDFYDISKKEMSTRTVNIVSLLSVDGIRFMLTSAVGNFTGFYALGTVFTVMVGVSVAEGTGFLITVLRKIAQITPKFALTPAVVFIGIMSNMASSSGYVVFVPLAALLFASFGRHPIAGLASAFAGVSGGWSANLLLGTNDPVFASITTQAAQILDGNFIAPPTANWYFMIVSTFLITALGTFVTDKIIEPRLGKYTEDTAEAVQDITANEKKGILWALISMAVFTAIILAMLLPENSILRNPVNGSILQSPFMSGIIAIMMLFFLIPGIFYGIGSGTIKNDKDIINLMTKSISGLSGFFILLFFAGQFVAHFNYSNLGTVISVKGAEVLSGIGFVGLPLILAFVVLTAVINLFIAVDLAKWALMAPVFVPMFMRLGLSPELTQVAYRIGDSATNVIAPLMPFFALIVAFCQRYNKNSGIGTLISTMLPYSVVFLFGWLILLTLWYILGLPLGPGSGLVYPAAG